MASLSNPVIVTRERTFRGRLGLVMALPGVLLRTFKQRTTGDEFVWRIVCKLGSEAEQLRHKFCFGHHVFFRYPSHSPLPHHVHGFDPFERAPRTWEGFVALR